LILLICYSAVTRLNALYVTSLGAVSGRGLSAEWYFFVHHCGVQVSSDVRVVTKTWSNDGSLFSYLYSYVHCIAEDRVPAKACSPPSRLCIFKMQTLLLQRWLDTTYPLIPRGHAKQDASSSAHCNEDGTEIRSGSAGSESTLASLPGDPLAPGREGSVDGRRSGNGNEKNPFLVDFEPNDPAKPQVSFAADCICRLMVS
jgi:hypothetical protein